jgi:hypothetical protein
MGNANGATKSSTVTIERKKNGNVVDVNLCTDCNVTDYIDVSIPTIMIYLEEFLTLVKHGLNFNTLKSM